MFVSRIVRRAFGAAARSKAYSTSSEASDSAAATVSVKRTLNPLEEFFEPDRNTDEEKPVTYGRGWKASELRLKSWDDLHKLWYVLLKEKNMLMTQRQMLNAQNLRFTNPERIQKEKKLKLHNELLKSHNGVFRPRNAGDNCFLRCMSTTGQPEISYKEESSIESPEAEQAQRIKFKRPDKTAKHIMNILDKEEVNKVQAEREIPDIRPGYIIQLKVEVPENKRRTSNIKGIVIARRNAGLNTTFRLRRIVAGVGIESVYPLYSPNIKEIKVLDKKRVRRAKLYYLRERMNPFKP